MKEINIRRATRQYTDKEVTNEQIDQILRAAMQAPSAGNQQPWEFIVVRDKEKLELLSKSSIYGAPVKNAAVAIVMLGNNKNIRHHEYLVQDMSAAAQNLWLETVAQGLGAVWIGIAPREERMSAITDLFDLPEYIEPFAIMSIGEPRQENKFIDRFDKMRIHFEKYRRIDD